MLQIIPQTLGCIYFFELEFFFSLAIYASANADSFALWGTSILFSMVAISIYIPTNSVGEFIFLHTLSRVYCKHFDDSHWQEWADYLLWKNVYSGFMPNFKLDCLFLILSYLSSLYILDTNHLVDISFANIFSHSVHCLFVLLMAFFTVQKF